MSIRSKYTRWIIKKGFPWYLHPLTYFLYSPSIAYMEAFKKMAVDWKKIITLMVC